MISGNSPAIASNDAYSTTEDSSLLIDAAGGVLANDVDADFDPLQAILVDDVVHGTLTLNPDGSFAYTPDPDFNGTDSFTYTASDGSIDSNLATVMLTVTPVNDTPVASYDNYLTPPDTPLSVDAAGVLANDSDVDLNPLDAVLVDDVVSGYFDAQPRRFV